MNDRLTIPKLVKVGFQNRSDTYSGKLAYVVYIDNKGVLRKEKSWEGWRDKKITPEELPNEPTQGFVLNKDVGGTQRSWSWNARREKVRVYDPRNFEFEISVENLLFILQECSSIKGKGLEGEFVYSWAGTELVLLPVASQEYKGSLDFTNLQVEKVSAKDVKEGFSYMTKDKKEVMYLGRFNWWEEKYVKDTDKTDRYYNRYGHKVYKGEKKHVFIYLSKINTDVNGVNENDEDDWNPKAKTIGKNNYLLTSGFTDLAKKTSENPLPQFAEEFDRLSKTHYVSKPVKIFLKDTRLKTTNNSYYENRSLGIEKDGAIFTGSFSNHYGHNYGNKEKENEEKFNIDFTTIVELKDDIISIKSTKEEKSPSGSGYTYWEKRNYTYSGLLEENLTIDKLQSTIKRIVIEHENGSKSYLE